MRPVYRKVALERLSSPEQLDMLMKVTDPRGWLAFLALAILLVTALAWSIVTTLPIELGAPISLQPQRDATLYLSPADSQQVDVGMPVRVVVPGGTATTVLTGEVVSIGDFPVVNADTTIANPIALQVEFDDIPDNLPAGTHANATILLGTQRPIELIIPLR